MRFGVFLLVVPLGIRAVRREERGVAHLRRGPGEHALLAAQANRRWQFQESRSGLAVQDGESGAAAGVQSGIYAADGGLRLVEAPSQGLPICLYDPSCSGALGYKDLADEVAA